jgi:hypothetical protein
MKKTKPIRERAARALCEFHGHPPDIKMDGQPMWMSYLPEVDAVLREVLDKDEWNQIISGETVRSDL